MDESNFMGEFPLKKEGKRYRFSFFSGFKNQNIRTKFNEFVKAIFFNRHSETFNFDPLTLNQIENGFLLRTL